MVKCFDHMPKLKLHILLQLPVRRAWGPLRDISEGAPLTRNAHLWRPSWIRARRPRRIQTVKGANVTMGYHIVVR